jgi:hypothetical protein
MDTKVQKKVFYNENPKFTFNSEPFIFQRIYVSTVNKNYMIRETNFIRNKFIEHCGM